VSLDSIVIKGAREHNLKNVAGFELGKRMLDRGVLVSGTLVNARVIRVEPPLTITQEEADYVCRELGESLASMEPQPVSTSNPS